MAKIAVGGFQHETNTFAPFPATYDDFAQADGWPGLTRGGDMFDAVAGINLPIAGFVEAIRGAGHGVTPLLWCSAPPSARVTTDAFERITAMICADLASGGPFDAVYLDLHGAMVTDDYQDGEGEVLRRVRAVVGERVPIIASLDLHTNITEAMVARAAALIAYRTYPHIDMAETGERAARLLVDMFARDRAPAAAFRKLPYLIPLTAQCTLYEPSKSLYARLGALEAGGVASLSFAPGFPPADILECGPAVTAYAWDAASAEHAADALYDEVMAREAGFKLDTYSVDQAVARALANTSDRPVVLADTQDNPGAGGNADTVWLLEALAAADAPETVVAMMFDPATAEQAHEAGEGATIEPRLGAWSGLPGHTPFTRPMVVERLGDGAFTATGPMWLGSRMRLGRMALLRVADAPGRGVRVIVASRKLQAGDQAIFRHLGVEPAAQRTLALKSSVHFRADFEPLACEVLVVEAPGPNTADPAKLPYKNLREGVRLTPGA